MKRLSGWRYLDCAGGCARRIWSSPAVKYVICGSCCQRLNSVWERLESKKKKREAV